VRRDLVTFAVARQEQDRVSVDVPAHHRAGSYPVGRAHFLARLDDQAGPLVHAGAADDCNGFHEADSFTA